MILIFEVVVSVKLLPSETCPHSTLKQVIHFLWATVCYRQAGISGRLNLESGGSAPLFGWTHEALGFQSGMPGIHCMYKGKV